MMDLFGTLMTNLWPDVCFQAVEHVDEYISRNVGNT